MLFVKVLSSAAENLRRKLIKKGLLAVDYQVVRKGGFIYFPVKEACAEMETVEMEAQSFIPKYFKLKDLLSKLLTPSELESLTTSFDVVGDVIIIEIPKGLEKKEEQIARAVLKVHKNAKVVAKKTGPMGGEFRVRKLKVILGENRTETLYKEHGVRIKLDPAKVYFSIRLSSERRRIAELVKPGENILALFAGVGPFPLVISRFCPDAKIVAIELNPDAVFYMRQNIELNKFKNILAIEGDARQVVLSSYLDFADRVLMTLPKSAETFLDVAFAGVKDKGIVHLYGFVPADDPYSSIKKRVSSEAKKIGVSVEFTGERIVRPYAPRIVQVAIDFKVHKIQ